MQNLAAWVSQAGGGLMLTGGRDGYGAGRILQEPAGPACCPSRWSCGGSTASCRWRSSWPWTAAAAWPCPASDGRPKIELADLATAEVVNMLGPTDQFGCIAVDTVPHVIVPVSDVTDKAGMCRKILRIDSSGGGIYIYEALETAGAMVASAKAGTRHIILFADAADAGATRRLPAAGRQLRQGRHHGQRDRPGHRAGLRRRLLEGHCPAGRRPVHVHQTWPRNCPGCSPRTPA